ncbi:MAG TPA: ABC transporter permease [Azospirillaceae bacterium]|nr:ABC transporter permease [Azospirillaceae bacterium]
MNPLVFLPLVAVVLPFGAGVAAWQHPAALVAVGAALASLLAARLRPLPPLAEALVLLAGVAVAAAASLLLLDRASGIAAPGLWVFLVGLAALFWHALTLLAQGEGAGRVALVAGLFGLALVYLWEAVVRGFGVPSVLLPAPSAILAAMPPRADVLWDDFRQTVLHAVVRGYLIGCLSGFAVAIVADRIPFLARGLLPLGNLVSAIPIVGIAPIMVMWFGFGWESKAAVVVVMTFFPMLVNTLAGLQASEKIQLDLMRSYGAGYVRTLVKLRLPNALPFLFNGLKINSTLALIGAIVAEFFGTPIVGMGFRISTEVARMNLDIVWATIVVAGITGSTLYGALALAERAVTGWHPSVRRRR